MSSCLSRFSSFPKFKDELAMPFTKSQPEDLSELRDLAYGWGKVVILIAIRTREVAPPCDYNIRYDGDCGSVHGPGKGVGATVGSRDLADEPV